MRTKEKIGLTFALLIAVHFLLVIVFGDNGLVELGNKRRQLQQMEEENARLEEENYRLYTVIERLRSDPQYIESVARHQLGMIAPDEIVVRFGRNGKAVP